MNKPLIYLSGPIHAFCDGPNHETGERHHEGAKQWRMTATKLLHDSGIGVLDPTDRTYDGENVIDTVQYDMLEIRKCDGVLAYVPQDVPMTGTPMEIFYASHSLVLPVYSFPLHTGPWIKYFTNQFETLEEAVEHLSFAVLLDTKRYEAVKSTDYIKCPACDSTGVAGLTMEKVNLLFEKLSDEEIDDFSMTNDFCKKCEGIGRIKK